MINARYFVGKSIEHGKIPLNVAPRPISLEPNHISHTNQMTSEGFIPQHGRKNLAKNVWRHAKSEPERVYRRAVNLLMALIPGPANYPDKINITRASYINTVSY